LITSIPFHASFRYQIGDLLLNRTLLITKKIQMNFFTGGRGAYISQKWRVKNIANDGSYSSHRTHWAFKGGGIRIGLGSLWNLSKGFNFFSNGSVSALYGDYDNEYKASSTAFPAGNRIDDADFGDNRLAFGAQLTSGFAWMTSFNDYKQILQFYAGYELNGWFNINETYQLSTFPTQDYPNSSRPTIMRSSSVSLQGLVAGIVLKF
jgi:hypothetical protein